MPKITITGESKPSIFGTSEDRANANWLNQNYNARASFQERQQRAKERMEREKYLGMRREADYENSQRDAAARSRRNEFDASYREAMYHNQNFEIQRRLKERQERQSYNTMRREADMENAAFNFRARRTHAAQSAMFPGQHKSFVQRYGNHEALGSLSGAYYNQEVRRLGNLGSNAINHGDLKELIRIDRTLAKMEKGLDKYTKANTLTGQEQEANRKKAREVLAASYTNVSMAAEYAPGLKGVMARAVVSRRAAKARAAAGGGFSHYGGHGGGGGKGGGGGFLGGLGGAAAGALGDLAEGAFFMADPALLGIGAAAAAYEIPNSLSYFYGSTYKSAQPYYDLRKGAGALGLNMGGRGSRFLNSIYGGRPSALQSTYGLSPTDMETILSNYGIVPHNTHAALNAVRRISAMGYQPGLAGMGTSTYEDIARMQSVYNMGSGSTQKFQKIMEDAVTVGADRAQVFHSMKMLLQQNVGAGGLTSGIGGTAALMNRLMSAGTPGARTGATAISFNAGISSTLHSLGSNPVSSLPMYRYMMAHGGMPKTDAAIASMVGKDRFANLQKSAAGKRLIEDIKNSPNPYVALRYLGIGMQGEGARTASIYRKYGYFTGGPSSLQDLGLSVATNTPLSSAVTYSGSFPMGHGQFKAIPSPYVLGAIHTAAKATGISAAALYGLIGGESTFRVGAVNGSHVGLGQMSPAALKDVHMSGADMTNPRLAALASARYLKKMYGLFNGHHLSQRQHLIDAYDSYYWGEGHKNQILAGNVPANIAAGTASKMGFFDAYNSRYGQIQRANQRAAQAGNAPHAIVGNMAMSAAQKSAEASMKVLSDFSGSAMEMSHAVTNFSSAVANFGHIVSGMKTMHASPAPRMH